MRCVKLLVLITLLTKSELIFGQDLACDSIYSFGEIMPNYPDGEQGLVNYFNLELMPILNDSLNDDVKMISKIYIKVNINSHGQVVEADIIQKDLSAGCKAALVSKLLTMQGWSPGIHKGQPACMSMTIPVKITYR
ncbi:MAG: hypothetical protein RLZZ262_532 [Bacteroidota bacterium]|jgi:hypothetical protein